MTEPNLNEIARRIDTGEDDSEATRALIVFNLTDAPLSGVAAYEASITWPVNKVMPFIAVMELGGETVASDFEDQAEGPDPKGRDDHRLLAFDLRFAVRDVPARGWRTYIASYADEQFAPDPEGLDSSTPGLQVVETMRRRGDLSPTGIF